MAARPSSSRPAVACTGEWAKLWRAWTRARSCPRAPSRSRPRAASRPAWRCASRGRRSWRRTRSPTGVERHRLIDATHDSIAQASAIQLLRDRFAAYPEVRSFLAAYDEPHRTVQDKIAALLTPTRHHVISRAQHARVSTGSRGGGTGGLAALGFGVLKARNKTDLITDNDGHQLYTFSITSENAAAMANLANPQ